jgi:hypothetical protein
MEERQEVVNLVIRFYGLEDSNPRQYTFRSKTFEKIVKLIHPILLRQSIRPFRFEMFITNNGTTRKEIVYHFGNEQSPIPNIKEFISSVFDEVKPFVF